MWLIKGSFLEFEMIFEFEGRLRFSVQLVKREESEFFSERFLKTPGKKEFMI